MDQLVVKGPTRNSEKNSRKLTISQYETTEITVFHSFMWWPEKEEHFTSLIWL